MKTSFGNLFVSLCLLAVGVTSSARAQIGALGVMGDSLSDEYFEEGYGGYATNWTEQLVIYRSVNIGPTAAEAGQPGGTWDTVRRTGYEYNWALSGDTSSDLLTDGQDSGLAAQIVPDGITHAVLAIGANDFNPDFLTYSPNAYLNIYDNSWSTSQISNYVAQILTNIETAIVTVSTTGVKLVVFNILDYGKTPAVYNNILYLNGGKRERVSSFIQQANAGIAFLAQKYQIPLVDAFRLQQVIFGSNTNLQSTLLIGNVVIHLQQSDTNPTNSPNRSAAFVADKAHPHTTIQGLFANMALEAFRLGYGADVPDFTEQEILAHAGVPYGGSDTLMAQIGAYTNYVILPKRPAVTGVSFVGTDFQLQFATASNQLYLVEMTSSLENPSWTPLTNNVPGTGGIVLVTDPDAAAQTNRFYRVRQMP
ncbi:MAG TPA: SGNH/GDSL hydrolase family protein [Verrucomicrobiae bacterium]|nr:SGNH/GDSL hydrolase family protein [Verrucomicrobiae bacterium]